MPHPKLLVRIKLPIIYYTLRNDVSVSRQLDFLSRYHICVFFVPDVSDANFVATIDNWLLADDSDEDLDIEIDNDACALPVVRNAANEPACDNDMTELQTLVLRTEDDANDRALRDLIQNEDYYKFDWTRDRQIFTGRREVFTGTSGPTFDVTDMTPVDLFHKMFDNDFIDGLCRETNRYAEQKIAILASKNIDLAKSRLHRWTPTNPDEMVTFLAILILQGLYPVPEEEKYFSFNGFGTMPYFSRIMSYNRFLLLKSLYHFVDNQTVTNRTKLTKIQPVLDYLNDKFSTMYMPSQEIAIDESLLKWHGRLSFAQKIATKAAQVGVKTYELCESRTGYLWKFIVYVGKKTNIETAPTNNVTNDMTNDMTNDVTNDMTNDATNETDDVTNEAEHATVERPDDETDDGLGSSVARPTNATAKIVFDLVEPLLNRGHTIIMDNFYNSPLLLRCLKKHQTDCYGTLRLNREFVPDSLKTISKSDLRQGEVVASYCSDLSVMVWRDSNLVSMISTYHQLQIGNQNKYNRLTYKPKIVLDYNKSMGGVDRKDQFLSAQPVERLRNKVWYKKVFARLLSTKIFNLFIIYQTKHQSITHRQFRTTLAEGLLRQHARIDLTTEPRLYVNRQTRQLTRHTYSRPLVEHDHFPARSTAKRPRCWLCARIKRDTRTTWKCIQCDIHLCIEHCFREYHKNPQ